MATHSILRCLHLPHEFTPSYFTVILIFPLFHFGRASSTISTLSELDSSIAFHFPAALESLTFLAFSVFTASFFLLSSAAAAAAAATSAVSLFFLSSSTCFYSASSFSLFFLSCATAFAARYFSWAARTSASESEEGELLRDIVKEK